MDLPQPPTATNVICPAESNWAKIHSAQFPVPFDFGWLYLNLNTTVAAAGVYPPVAPAAAQPWVTDVMDAEGRFRTESSCARREVGRRLRV